MKKSLPSSAKAELSYIITDTDTETINPQPLPTLAKLFEQNEDLFCLSSSGHHKSLTGRWSKSVHCSFCRSTSVEPNGK